MALYAISDIHLSLGTDKPMDIFSNQWEGYVLKLKKNWIDTIRDDDIVLIPGDVSWATYIEDAYKDFDFINSLPGKKIISKGNHDYWWTTLSKMEKCLEYNGYASIKFLHNNCYTFNDWVICGTRGWQSCEKFNSSEDEKIFKREIKRLELSLECGIASGVPKTVAVLHYPPFNYKGEETEFIEIMKKYNVGICIYGHLHADFSMVKTGVIDGIDYKFVSSDYLNFKPMRIL